MPETSAQKIEGVPNFWMHVLRAERRVLFLDYDGTLAPFEVERMAARPLEGTSELLTEIAEFCKTRLVIVSGRPLVELVALLGPGPVEMVGSHGFEIRNTEGKIRRVLPDPAQSEGLESAQRLAASSGYEARIERKVASIAFHTRGSLDDQDLNESAKCLWLDVATKYGLELREFNGGIELRATGTDKGTAVVELLRTEPDHSLAVYVGDDDTDEDAFRAIKTRGIGIKVGGYGMRTAAAGRLPNCPAVRSFLESWFRLTKTT
jgi:trehalose 6-phosphate phosphatase